MHVSTSLRLRVASLLCGLLLLTPPAHAVNKDMVQLQTQIQALQDAVARLQQSNDERMGVLKDLVQQTADSVNKMSTSVDTLDKQMRAQQEAAGAKSDQLSGQIQALNDSIDEIRARLGRIDKAMTDVQGQQQSINATLQNLAPGSGGAPAPVVPAPSVAPVTKLAPVPAGPVNQPPTQAGDFQSPPPATPGRKPSAAIPQADTAAPPIDALYKTALGDYMAAKYPLATSEFVDVIKYYPDNTLAGNAYYYLGEIDYRNLKLTNAVKDYDRVLEQYTDNNKVPAAHLHKGEALLAMKQNDAGVRELRALIQRFPNSPEAMQARSKLSGMGVPVTPKH